MISLFIECIGSAFGSFSAWSLGRSTEKSKNDKAIDDRMNEILFFFNDNMETIYLLCKSFIGKTHTNQVLKQWLIDGVITTSNQQEIEDVVTEVLTEYQRAEGIWKMSFKWDDINFDIFQYGKIHSNTVRKNTVNSTLTSKTVYYCLHKLYLHIDSINKTVESINSNNSLTPNNAFSPTNKAESILSKCKKIRDDYDQLFVTAPNFKTQCVPDNSKETWEKVMADLCDFMETGNNLP